MNDFVLEEDYFGEKIGKVTLCQLPYIAFQHECAQSRSTEKDHTGLRIHAGAHIGVRLLLYLSAFLEGKSVVELGCGVGVMSLIGTKLANADKIVLTDGELHTLEVAKLNMLQIYKEDDSALNKFDFAQLRWGNDSHLKSLLNKLNEDKHFDVVIGCELIYYNTDLNALVQTVLSLTDHSSGLFIHSHLFRKAGQENELIDLFSAAGWITYELPHRSFVSTEELRHHPEWLRVRVLVSGPQDVMNRLKKESEELKYCVMFREVPLEDCDEDDEEADTEGLVGLFG